jgi:hypothetical protein
MKEASSRLDELARSSRARNFIAKCRFAGSLYVLLVEVSYKKRAHAKNRVRP